MSLLDALHWRSSVKKFDTAKDVSSEDTDTILEAIRLAPTSFGFQPFKIHIIKDKKSKEGLKDASVQAQIIDSSFLLVFSADTDFSKRIDEFMSLVLGDDEEKRKEISPRWEKIKGMFASKTEAEKISWASKQAYIALGFALIACAELGIDSCPMEGFDTAKLKAGLKLPENLYPQAILAVGYRSKDEIIKPKIRFPKENLFTEI